MTYEVRYIKRSEDGDELIAFEDDHFEAPSEDYLRDMVEKTGATFADVCRKDDECLQ